MRESQLRELIKEELKFIINESQKEIGVSDVFTLMFENKDIKTIGNIIESGIRVAIDLIEDNSTLEEYSNLLDDLENKFEEIIFNLRTDLSEIDTKLNY